MNNNNYQYSPLKDEDLATNTNNTNNILIWLDEEALNSTLPNTRLTIDMFKSIANTDYELYNSSELFLTDIDNTIKTRRVIVIMSGWFAEKLLSELSVSLLREISPILIFCQASTNYQYSLKKYGKVIDICTDEQCLKEVIQDQLNPSTNLLVMGRDLNPLFILNDNNNEFNLYKQYIELLKSYPWTTSNRKKMIDECIKHYRKNTAMRQKIEEFKYSYTPETAIQWYTKDSFLYRLVNKALRLLDMDQINIFRPYIKDLCTQLEHLHEQNQSNTPLTVYRGHGNMNIDHFETIQRNIGGLISFNGFLSTTTNYEVAIIYAGSRSTQDKSVIYEIRTNHNSKNVVFADISKFSDIVDEQEVLFSLCSIFRIDNIIDDIGNDLSKIIMSTTDQDTINIERKQCLPCMNHYYRKQNIIKVSAAIIIVAIMTFGIFFGISMMFKNKNRSSYNCTSSDCITTTSINTPSSVTKNSLQTISTTSKYVTTSTRVSTLGPNCVPVGWNYEGDLITNDQPGYHLAIANNENVYVAHQKENSLDKWSPQGILIKKLYSGSFNVESPLFYHSPSQSLYFCNFWNNKTSVFKITDENPVPIYAIENMTSELGEKLYLSSCSGLYVNTLGDIFMLDTRYKVIRKWTSSSSSFIVVARLNMTNPLFDESTRLQDFAIDEVNNIIYLLVRLSHTYKSINFNSRILKYINGSEYGITIIDATPIEMFPSTNAVDIDLYAIILDKTGYIIISESKQISIWSSDGEFKGVAIGKYRVDQSAIRENIYVLKMVLDGSGNLYAYVQPGYIAKFNRTSSTCKNNTV